MFRMKIKLLSVIFLVIGFCGILSAAENQIRKVVLSDTPTETKLLSNHKDGFDIEFKVGTLQIEEVKTKGGVFDEIRLQDYGFSSRTGEPKLPVFSRIIAVPVGASVSFDVISRKQKVFSQKDSGLLHRLIPAQRSISKSEDPDKVPFELNNALYQRDALTANELFTVTEIGFMRGVRVFQMEYEPVQYNPLSGELKVNYEVQIRVSYDNPDFAATEALRARTASYEFDRMYGSVIYNWRNDYRPPVTNYPTKMLILCPPAYTTALQTFVDWKIQQGFNVIVTTVGTGGTVANTTTAINTYMAGVWSAATPENPAPTYLLIVGDTSTSGNNIIANTGAAGSHVTDLTYVRLEGGDYIPEMYYGRFSVSSETELNNIINKTIMFEKTLMPDLSYLGNVVMIAGVDATYAPNWGNGQINYGTTHYFNATNGTTSNTYLYPESGSSDATIIANANAGRGYMNYTAHGSETSWADPTFTVSDVNAMTNTNKFGVMVGNCCVTNAFGTGVCFGESIIRKANAGGVIYIGATNNSYWDEDYWWGIGYKTPIQAAAHAYSASTLGAYDTMFHTHGEAFSNWAQ
ncbi:MAG: gingipain R, partial [Candidatus Cloacimonetes bacterium]|nr:gingipain R [Candidatus Cloacimonadota bacterium]